jgi:hypothetical protein
MIDLHPNILTENGKKVFAVLPYNEFLKIQEALSDYEDLKLLRKAKLKEADDPAISLEEAKKLLEI